MKRSLHRSKHSPSRGQSGGPPVQLSYPGKRSLRRILSETAPAALQTAGQWGEPRPDGWRNRLIQAENLAALRALLDEPAVAGQVALAYLDPPFATAQTFRSGRRRTATVSSSRRDRLAYQDHAPSAAYLEFLRQRLLLVKELLATHGSIYVHIGPQMSHYVRALLDEIFGAGNFLSEIARVKCNPKNFRRRAYGNIKDTVLFYSAAGRHVWNEPRQPMTEDDLARLFPRLDSQGRRYATTPLHAPGETRHGRTGQPWKGLLPPPGRHWRATPEEFSRLDQQGRIEWSASGNPRKKIFAYEVARVGKKRQDIWTFKDPQYPVYPTEKNLAMLEMIVCASSNAGDLVLDCFAGSGTTLVAAEKHGRRWIGVDASPLAIQCARRRLLALPGCSGFELLKSARSRAEKSHKV